MKTYLVKKYLVEKKDLLSPEKREKIKKALAAKRNTPIKSFDDYNDRQLLDLMKKVKIKINEASGAGGSSEVWFGYNRAKYIYLESDKVLFSYFYEFPPGHIMTTEDKQRARALGYIILDMKPLRNNPKRYMVMSDM